MRLELSRGLRGLVFAAGLSVNGFSAEPAVSSADADAEDAKNEAADHGDALSEDPVMLNTMKVSAGVVEDFGLQFGYTVDRANTHTIFSMRYKPYVQAVRPNTAASRAGLKPGDVIVSSNGQSVLGLRSSAARVWRGFYMPPKARAAIEADKPATWILEVQSGGSTKHRTITLQLPTPAPHWGSPVWTTPADREPAVIPENGPLAERAKTILDNGIWETMPLGRQLGISLPNVRRYLGYRWVAPGSPSHTFHVSQLHGHTDIVLQCDRLSYLTSPTGVLVRAIRLAGGFTLNPWKEVPLEEARAGFEREVNFWLHDVDKVSARWPLERKMDAAALAELKDGKPGAVSGANTLPAAFLKLPRLTDAQRRLLEDALSKLGMEENRWAFIETVRDFEAKAGGQGEVVVRVDPSQPEGEDATLLKIDGHVASADEAKRWRDGGGGPASVLGDMPPLSRILEQSDARLFKDTAASIVYEIALKANSADFPAEKFQALVAVNKAQRSLEKISIALRDSMKVMTGVKVTEAGAEVRFRTIDPAFPPQPEYISIGGAVRAMLLIKVSRKSEILRADFHRVEPHLAPAP
jgi:hypothetical protein